MIPFALLLALASSLPQPTQSAPADPLRVFLRAGPKTHGPGEHDHPRFLAEWSELLAERGAAIDGGLEFPTADQLAQTDVLVLYAAEGGSLDESQRVDLDRYLARGGGIVALHDAVCGNDPHWFKTVIGGAWEHGHSKWHMGKIGLYMNPAEHPITQGIPHFDLEDEIYHDLHLHPDTKVLASSFHTPFDVTPQLWTYEPGSYRAFVSIQGHYHDTFSHPAWRSILLRGIAWAGERDADTFLTPEELESLRYPPGGPLPPSRAQGEFELHPEFEITCVAAEPDVVNPISIDWDREGRMWVACTIGYPYKEEFSGVPAHDQIVILSDSNGDGVMDDSKLFHEGLDLVTSLVKYRDGVIVSAAPQILFLRDTTGDDSADTIEVLYDGFGYRDTHAVVSNMRFGPDGWIYCTQGYSGGGSKDIRGGGPDRPSFGQMPNGMLRFRPDGTAMELVSSYGSNTWGLDFDANGELFFTMANGSHLRHVIMAEALLEGQRVGGVNSWKDIVDHRKLFPIHSDERTSYFQIDFVGGFTAAAGCLIQSGSAWPQEFYGNHFVCEPTVNLIHRDSLQAEGVSFLASKPRHDEFLASRDLWFRPVHLRTGPDGAMYVLDFYNQAIVHNDTRGPEHGPTNAAVRPDRDKLHGRIWRVQHNDAKNQGERFLPLRSDPNGLMKMFSYSDAWHRQLAERLLRETVGEEAVPPLLELLAYSSYSHARLHALNYVCSTSTSHSPAQAAVALGLRDDAASVRQRAAWLAGPILKNAPSAQVLVPSLLRIAESDPQPRTRLAALHSLGSAHLDQPTLQRLVPLYSALSDDWSRSALLGALLIHPPASLKVLMESQDPNDGQIALGAELGRRIGDRRDAHLTAAALLVLSAEEGSDATRLSALTALHESLGADQVLIENGATMTALTRLLGSPSAAIASIGLALASRWEGAGLEGPKQELGARLLAQASDPESSYAACLEALTPLLSLESYRTQALECISDLLAPHAPLEVQLHAIKLLGDRKSERAGTLLTEHLSGLGAQAKEAALEVLLSRTLFARVLLDAIGSDSVQTQDLGARFSHRLRFHPDSGLSTRAQELLAPKRDASVAAQLEALLPLVQTGGDPARGKVLFAEHCGTCHSFEGAGADIGPNLTGMGAHGVEELLGIVLDPNREVEAAYVEFVAQTLQGETVTGIMVRETSQAVVLRNTGGEVEVARRDIESLRSTGMSLMPTGLGDLGPEVLRDIMAHLTHSTEGYRALSLDLAANVDCEHHLFDDQRDEGYRFTEYGLRTIDGVPYSIPDPANGSQGTNIIVLKGGVDNNQAAKTDYPQRVVIGVNAMVQRIHVLGGAAAWGHPWGSKEISPIVKWTWLFEDGTRSEEILHNGRQFADWIARYDVPDSSFVEGLLAGGPGQVRHFTVDLPQPRQVKAVALESYDNYTAPLFIAMTAQAELEPSSEREAKPEHRSVNTWILGGGSSHDFERWFKIEDSQLLSEGSDRLVRYTLEPTDLLGALELDDVLIFCTNQPLPPEVQQAIEDHVTGGGALLALHPGTWFNWPEWPNLHHDLLGGGARGHEPLRPFEVQLARADHPALQGVPASFSVTDELYRSERDNTFVPIEILAYGKSAHTPDRFPVVWTPQLKDGRVLVITLGHDGDAHQHPAFRALLRSGVEWLEQAR